MIGETTYYLISDIATGYICITVVLCVIVWKVAELIDRSI